MIDRYREEAEKLLKSVDGYGEIRFERRITLSILVENGTVKIFSRKVDMGGFVRILLRNHGWGVATFNDLTSLAAAFEDAVSASRLIMPESPIRLVESEPGECTGITKMEDPYSAHSDEEKLELARKYNELLRENGDRIIQATTSYFDQKIEKFYTNTFGVTVTHDIVDGGITVMARARQGNDVQQYHNGWSNRERFSDLTKLDDGVIKVKKVATDLLSAKPVRGGTYTVVLDPRLAGVFVHEAFGHLSEADFILENPQAQEMMTLGRRFGPSFLNIIDDGAAQPHLHGTIEFDDEGVRAQKTYLVQNGVLVGRLHSRETAAKLGEDPTGNARAENYRKVPLVRMTNTAIEKGPHPADQIFDGIKEGLYAIDAYGGQTMLENFSFSAAYGYMIRNGGIAEMVKNVVMQGNLFKTLANIEFVADDFKWARWAGMCGKGGQSVPVDVGAPHIRIREVTIGG